MVNFNQGCIVLRWCMVFSVNPTDWHEGEPNSSWFGSSRLCNLRGLGRRFRRAIQIAFRSRIGIFGFGIRLRDSARSAVYFCKVFGSRFDPQHTYSTQYTTGCVARVCKPVHGSRVRYSLQHTRCAVCRSSSLHTCPRLQGIVQSPAYALCSVRSAPLQTRPRRAHQMPLPLFRLLQPRQCASAARGASRAA